MACGVCPHHTCAFISPAIAGRPPHASVRGRPRRILKRRLFFFPSPNSERSGTDQYNLGRQRQRWRRKCGAALQREIQRSSRRRHGRSNYRRTVDRAWWCSAAWLSGRWMDGKMDRNRMTRRRQCCCDRLTDRPTDRSQLFNRQCQQ